MSGKLLIRARRDARKHLKSGGFEETILLETVDASISIETKGWASKHWINFDADGVSVNSKNAHITLDELELVSLNYPVRNENKEVYLFNHRIFVSDSSGELKSYVIKEWFPDETLGLITCILGDYEFN